eukprot:4578650-Ditylum_brightwellii.AAC.1
MSKMLKTLCGVEGDDKQASLKLHKALVSTKVDAFSCKIRAYKAAVATNDRLLDFTKLTNITSMEYTFLVMCGQWPFLPRVLPQKREPTMIL